jgi:ribose transport system ATP-binding protein
VGSKAEIYRLIGHLAAQGKAVLVVSSYLPELLGVCDRIAVMCRGVLGAARAVEQVTAQQVMLEATGAGAGAEGAGAGAEIAGTGSGAPLAETSGT